MAGLDDVQERLLILLVDAARRAPSPSQSFTWYEASPGAIPILRDHPGLRENVSVAKGDLEALAANGLLTQQSHIAGMGHFTLTQSGFDLYDSIGATNGTQKTDVRVEIEDIPNREDHPRRSEGRSRSQKPIIFISCGQRYDHEREVGNQLCEIVRASGYEPFFAQQRSDLRGLSEAILDTLHRASGYIAVLHRREKLDDVKGDDKNRASVFIEQELAVAAYIRRGRDLPVLFYVQRGVQLDGIRSTLLLNTSFGDRRDFEENGEVIEHVRSTLPTMFISEFSLLGPNLKLEIQPEIAIEAGGVNMLKIAVRVRNVGTEIPDHAIFRAWIPSDLLVQNQIGRAGQEGDFSIVQRTIDNAARIDPDRERPTLLVTITMAMIRGGYADKILKFRLVGNRLPMHELKITYGKLWKAANEGVLITESSSDFLA